MATRYIGSTADRANIGDSSSVIGAASGGTLAGSQKVQVVFDDAEFTTKQDLVMAVEVILERIKGAKVFPITSSS